jgi:spermidine synthase
MTFVAVMLCFLVSGMAGLVYQVVWTRYLALFLGHTSYAVVAVLVAFMGGLAIGNAWLGAKADRTERPLALYGWLEIGIAVYAAVFPTYYELCHSVFVSLARHFEPGSGPVLLLKFVFSLVTVLCPTTLMGATFPALTRFVTRSLSELREKVGALYFINSFGAVLGCLVADFWWIPDFGLELTVFCGAGLNLAAGLVALYMSKQFSEEETAVAAMREGGLKEESFSVGELRLALVGIGLSGFVAMLYEVAWTRVLALALGATTHAFSLMLVTFISGIAAGAWIIYRWRRLGRSLEAFAWAELALGVMVLGSMVFYADVPYWFLHGASLLSRQPASYLIYELLQALICFGVMVVPAACLGLTLPLVSRIATIELAHTGRSVGRVFAVNTVGTVLGAICTGLWLMPWLGLARTFGIGIVINSSIGLGILFRKQLAGGRWIAAPVVAFCFVWAIGAAFNQEWQRAFSAGLWRSPQPPATRRAFHEAVNEGKILYYRDGAGSTVTVISKRRGDKETLSLKVNGKTDAASAVDVTTQRLLGHIPMLLCPGSKEALVIGMGSGMTAGAVARHPSIQHVDIVEISPEVVQAARLFADYNDRFWENPKIRVTVEDAKSFLKISRRSYDAIISEPSNPWMAGVAGVFSHEYYEDCRARLQPNGVMAQWVQIYETSDELLDVVLRTFRSVFPYVSIWETSPADLVLVGSIRPLQIDLEAMGARFLEPAVSADLQRIEMVALPVLLAREAISQQNGAFVALEDGLIHSDFYPVLEFQAAKAFFLLGRANRWRYLDEKFSTRPTTLLGDYLKKHPLTEGDFKALARFYLEYGMPESDLFRSLLLRWQREQPEAILPMELMAQASEAVIAAELETLRLAPMADFLLKLAEKDPGPLRQYEGYLMQTYRAHRSVFNQPPTDYLESMLRRLLPMDPSNQRVYKCHLAEIAWDRGDDANCAELANTAMDPSVARGPANFSIDPKAPEIVLLRRMDTLCRNGKLAEAWALSQNARREGLLVSDPSLELMCRKLDACVSEGAVFQKK